MNWNNLQSDDQLDKLNEISFVRPQVIFKHSTRCSISEIAKNRIEKFSYSMNVDFHYLYLLLHRPLSNKISSFYNIHHESPQVLIIKNGECVYDESHNGIQADELSEEINKIL